MIALQPALKFNGGGDSRIKSYVLKGTVLPERHRIVYHCAERDTSVSLHAGHVNHSIFWENLTPPDVRISALCTRTHIYASCKLNLSQTTQWEAQQDMTQCGGWLNVFQCC